MRSVYIPLRLLRASVLYVSLNAQLVRGDAAPVSVEPTRTIELTADAKAVTFGPAGRTILAADRNAIHILDTASGKDTATVKTEDAVLSLMLPPDQKWVAGGGEGKTLTLLDPSTGKGSQTVALNAYPYSLGLAWSADGKKLASSVGKNVQIWDPTAGKSIADWKAEQGTNLGVAFSPDGTQLLGCASGGGDGPFDGIIYVWDATSGKEVTHFTKPAASHKWACFADAKTIVAPINGKSDGAAAFDVATGKPKYFFKASAGDTFTAGALSHDRKTLVTGDAGAGAPPRVQLWDASTGHQIATLTGLKSGKTATVAFSPDDKLILGALDGTTICVWTAPKH